MSEDQTGLIATELTKLVVARGGCSVTEESLLAMFGKFYNGIRDVSLERVKREQQAALRDFRNADE